MNGKFAPIMVDETDNIIMNVTKMIHVGSMDDVFILEKFDPQEIKVISFIQSSVPKIKEFIYYLRFKSELVNSPYMIKFEELLS